MNRILVFKIKIKIMKISKIFYHHHHHRRHHNQRSRPLLDQGLSDTFPFTSILSPSYPRDTTHLGYFIHPFTTWPFKPSWISVQDLPCPAAIVLFCNVTCPFHSTLRKISSKKGFMRYGCLLVLL